MSGSGKHRIYEQFSRIAKALAAPARLELLDVLLQGERSVDALARATQLSVPNASQHLQVLAGARLVDARREGQRVVYRVADESIEALWHALRHTAQTRLAELDSVVREYMVGRDDFEPVGRAELIARLKAGTITLIDVRPCPRVGPSSRTAAVPTACCRCKRSRRCASAALPQGGWRTGSPSGGLRIFRSSAARTRPRKDESHTGGWLSGTP
jgi:DNA-binding transcriptional ArsR family regulator